MQKHWPIPLIAKPMRGIYHLLGNPTKGSGPIISQSKQIKNNPIDKIKVFGYL